MQRTPMSRRGWFRTALAAVAALRMSRPRRAMLAPTELKVPDDIPVENFDFEGKGIEGWTTVAGQWAVEDVAVLAPGVVVAFLCAAGLARPLGRAGGVVSLAGLFARHSVEVKPAGHTAHIAKEQQARRNISIRFSAATFW